MRRMNLSSIIVLVTSAFSVTVLAFLLYKHFGFGAIAATLPFVGTLGFALAVAHYLDTQNRKEDEAHSTTSQKSPPPTSVSRDELAAKKEAASTAPRRRRVAD